MGNGLKEKANLLRRRGLMYSEIAKELGVAKSTAHLWTKDLHLTESEQKLAIDRHTVDRAKQITSMAAINTANRLERERKLQEIAVAIVCDGHSSSSNGKIMCALMFWCEGTKSAHQGLKFTNSDPDLMRTFLTLLRKNFDIDEAKFRVLMHLHEYHDETTQKDFWSRTTGIPEGQFLKTFRKPHTGKNYHEGYQGCINVRYHDSSLGKLLKMIYIEYGKNL